MAGVQRMGRRAGAAEPQGTIGDETRMSGGVRVDQLDEMRDGARAVREPVRARWHCRLMRMSGSGQKSRLRGWVDVGTDRARGNDGEDGTVMIAQSAAPVVPMDRTAGVTLMDREAWTGVTVSANSPVDTRSDSIDDFVNRVLGVAEASADPDAYAARRRRLLRQLEQAGPLPPAALESSDAAERMRTRRLIGQLVADGLAIRGSAGDEDTIHITDTGRRALHTTRSIQMDLIARILTDLAAGDAESADEAWHTLRAALGSSER